MVSGTRSPCLYLYHMAEISKTLDPVSYEDRWYQHWKQQGFFGSKPDKRPAYTIVIPPPNVTGILHMGHMLNNTIQDVLIRRKRMQGYNACWVPGTDHASIATEAKVVQMLAEKGIKKEDIGREEFLKHAWAWKEKYGGIILKQLEKLGASCDWNRTRFTMEEKLSESVLKVFVDLHRKGLIYRGYRMVNWDPQARTTVSDEEVQYKEVDGLLYYLRYRFADNPTEYLTVATTRPETILADVAVAVNPADERYKAMHGRMVLIPGTDRAIPIITDEYVDLEFGTGCLKVTPAHDINDYNIGTKHQLPVVDVLNEDGTLNQHGGKYQGMDRFVVRKQIIRDLKEQDLVEKEQPHKNNVGHSERTGAVIEPRLTFQWFLDMRKLGEPALKAVVEGEVNLIPDRFLNTYKHWMENIRDWNISRQLWWGHRIPAWYLTYTAGNGQQAEEIIVAETEAEARQLANDFLNGKGGKEVSFTQDPDVLDTWFSSWLWPISVFDGLTDPNNPDFKYYYPTNDLVTAPEILFFWVARMIMAGYEYAGKRPFQNVYLTGIVRDKQRRKMSKQLGNSPDPLDLIAQYGADSVRMGMLLSAPAGNDLLFDMSYIEQGRNFGNKIWNSFRLLTTLGESLDTGRPANVVEEQAIRWLQARIAEVSRELDQLFEQFRISEALMTIYKLIWDDFCSWYLEMIKPDRGEKISARAYHDTLTLFEDLLKLLHPFMPFLTEELWHAIRERGPKDCLIVAQLRTPDALDTDADDLAQMAEVRDIITEVRALRQQQNLPAKDPLPLQVLTDNFTLFDKYTLLLQRFAVLSEVSQVTESPGGTVAKVVKAHTLFLPQGELNVEDQMQKLQEEIAYTRGFLQSVEKKLSNEKFVANAQPDVVARERQKQADAEAKLAALEQQLAGL